MPGYKTHVVGGIASYVLLVYVMQKYFVLPLSPFLGMSLFFATVIGALFPDVDTKSKGQMVFYQCVALYLLLLLWYKKVVAFMVTTCVGIVPLLVPHRGMFHNISFLFVGMMAVDFGVLFVFPEKFYGIALHMLFFTVGALSHVMLDRLQTFLKVG